MLALGGPSRGTAHGVDRSVGPGAATEVRQTLQQHGGHGFVRRPIAEGQAEARRADASTERRSWPSWQRVLRVACRARKGPDCGTTMPGLRDSARGRSS